jgi:hypothetical protein
MSERRAKRNDDIKAKRRRFALVGCCEACGWRPPFSVSTDRCKCLHLHHVKPHHLGGGLEDENTLLLCPNCHAISHVLTRSSGGKIICGPTSKSELLIALRPSVDDKPINFREIAVQHHPPQHKWNDEQDSFTQRIEHRAQRIREERGA